MARKTPTAAQTAAAEEAHYLEMQIELEMRAKHRRGLLVPKGWQSEAQRPKTHKKDKVTMSLDADVLKWFRAMGPDFSSRINRVLRFYMLNVLSGELSGEWERDWQGKLDRRD